VPLLARVMPDLAIIFPAWHPEIARNPRESQEIGRISAPMVIAGGTSLVIYATPWSRPARFIDVRLPAAAADPSSKLVEGFHQAPRSRRRCHSRGTLAGQTLMTRTDEELVARSIDGDLDSFNQLVLRWERPIYALAYRVIGREEEARDVAQETFLRAFRALKGFKGQAKFSSWLYRITLNLCRDWMRRERRTPVAQAPDGVDIIELAGESTPSESIEDLVSRHQLGRAVARAMSQLPEEQRTAIILKEYHGLTFQEIADLIGCPLSTVKTRLYQGLTVLRRELAKNPRTKGTML
jgi:RNA polymerase sigma-70 factor (ECF subfamily)